MIINKRNEKSDGRGNFARGKVAIAIDDRSGFKRMYKDMVFEPGTNVFLHKEESDREFSLVSHPQNYPPERIIEHMGLKHAYSDTVFAGANGYLLEETGGSDFILLENGGDIEIE